MATVISYGDIGVFPQKASNDKQDQRVMCPAQQTRFRGGAAASGTSRPQFAPQHASGQSEEAERKADEPARGRIDLQKDYTGIVIKLEPEAGRGFIHSEEVKRSTGAMVYVHESVLQGTSVAVGDQVTFKIHLNAAGLPQAQAPLKSSYPSSIIYLDELSMPSRPNVEPAETDREVYVDPLPDEANLKDWLDTFGETEEVFRIPMAQDDTPGDKGYVKFKTHKGAAACVEINAGNWSESERALGSRSRRKKWKSAYSAYPENLSHLILGERGGDLQALRETVGAKRLALHGTKSDENQRMHFYVEAASTVLDDIIPLLETHLASAHDQMKVKIEEAQKREKEWEEWRREQGLDKEDGKDGEDEAAVSADKKEEECELDDDEELVSIDEEDVAPRQPWEPRPHWWPKRRASSLDDADGEAGQAEEVRLQGEEGWDREEPRGSWRTRAWAERHRGPEDGRRRPTFSALASRAKRRRMEEQRKVVEDAQFAEMVAEAAGKARGGFSDATRGAQRKYSDTDARASGGSEETPAGRGRLPKVLEVPPNYGGRRRVFGAVYPRYPRM